MEESVIPLNERQYFPLRNLEIFLTIIKGCLRYSLYVIEFILVFMVVAVFFIETAAENKESKFIYFNF